MNARGIHVTLKLGRSLAHGLDFCMMDFDVIEEWLMNNRDDNHNLLRYYLLLQGECSL